MALVARESMTPLDWWRQRRARERLALSCAAVATLLTLLFLLFEPALDERRRLAAGIPQLRQDLTWMQAQLDELRRLRAVGAARGATTASLSVAEVQRLLVELTLRAQFRQTQPASDRTVQLDFDAVNFAELAQFILRVEQQGLGYVSRAQIRRLAGTEGRVRAALTLRAY